MLKEFNRIQETGTKVVATKTSVPPLLYYNLHLNRSQESSTSKLHCPSLYTTHNIVCCFIGAYFLYIVIHFTLFSIYKTLFVLVPPFTILWTSITILLLESERSLYTFRSHDYSTYHWFPKYRVSCIGILFNGLWKK